MLSRRGLARTLGVPIREAAFRLRHPALHRRMTLSGGSGPRADGHSDEASRIAVIEDALALVPTASRTGSFVDVGCSRGRVLQVATRYPYQRILGVELSPELARFAERHVRDPRVEVFATDAGVWPVPEDVTVLYLFNPFGRQTMGLVLSAIIESQERRLRPIIVCDVSGVHHDLLEAAGFVAVEQVTYITIWRREPVSPSAP